MDKALELLNFYNIPDPVSIKIGVFNNEELQNLYDNLITQGSNSFVDVYTVSLTIEDKIA